MRHWWRALRARRAWALTLPAFAERPQQKGAVTLCDFDALFADGNDIREKPLLERKKILKALLPRDPLVRYSEHVAEFGRREFAKAQRAQEEGVIAKRAAGLCYSGKCTREWLKFKAVHEQEAVIVGYTEPRRSRKYFGSVVLAVRDEAKNHWVYAGHVGTGFDQPALKSLYGTM
jgi:bifunctional non-homologous end joining protein LigD